MFAIIQSGGKQYRVAQGDVLQLERLSAEVGDTLDLPVMMLGGDSVQVGTPVIEGAAVKAEVVSHGRGEKIYIRKFKAKSNYRRTNGHRQDYTEVRITDIPGAKADKKAASAKDSAATETVEAEAEPQAEAKEE